MKQCLSISCILLAVVTIFSLYFYQERETKSLPASIEPYTETAVILSDFTKSFNSLSKIVDVDHPVINAILNDALGKSSLAGITLKIDVFVSPQLALSPLVLSVILGNTLDNAIRACSGVSADTPKIVSLTLRQKDSILYYRISNPYDPEFSSKKREGIHGYGLKNVSSTVEQIGGTMQINQENNLYTVEIILNL